MPDPITARAHRPMYDAPPPQLRPRRSRVLLVALPMFAVFAAFGAVVWLAYKDGSYGSAVGEPPLIKASTRPIKVAPDEIGDGVPDQGEVRELLADAPTPDPMERLLPPEEEPLPRLAAREPAGAIETDEIETDEVVSTITAQPPAARETETTIDRPAPVTAGTTPRDRPATAGPSSPTEVARLEPTPERPATGSASSVAPAQPTEATPAEAEAALEALLDEVSKEARASATDEPVGISARRDDSPPAAAVPVPPAQTSPGRATDDARPEPSTDVAAITPGERVGRPATGGSARPPAVTPTPGPSAAVRPQGRDEPPTVIVPRIEPAPSPSSSLRSGEYRIQLAAVRAEADARRAWDLFLVDLGPVLQGTQPFIERAETANGVFYRVQVGSFSNAADAEVLCEELKRHNASCFVVRR